MFESIGFFTEAAEWNPSFFNYQINERRVV